MRKAFGLKFEIDWMREVDATAAEAGYTRTEYFEKAVELLMSKPSALTLDKDSRRPSRGVRRAYICEQCAPPRPRVFLGPDDPVPRCDRHGKMALQPNNSYFGRPV